MIHVHDLIQNTGLLESVSNLTVVSINSTTVLISWSPPFTLEGVPILGYNVTITNTTSGENDTMSVDTTMLYYSIDHPDPDNNFTVTVVPINGAGPGQVMIKAFLFSIGELAYLLTISTSYLIQICLFQCHSLQCLLQHNLLHHSLLLLLSVRAMYLSLHDC